MKLICNLFHYTIIVQDRRKIYDTDSWILLQCIAQRYLFAESGFCYVLHGDIDLLNLQLVSLMGILFKLERKKFTIPNLDFIAMNCTKDIDMLNLDFVTCYTNILICSICNLFR